MCVPTGCQITPLVQLSGASELASTELFNILWASASLLKTHRHTKANLRLIIKVPLRFWLFWLATQLKQSNWLVNWDKIQISVGFLNCTILVAAEHGTPGNHWATPFFYLSRHFWKYKAKVSRTNGSKVTIPYQFLSQWILLGLWNW